jgi:hypothetical protein
MPSLPVENLFFKVLATFTTSFSETGVKNIEFLQPWTQDHYSNNSP